MRNPFFNVVVRGVQHVTPQDMPNTQKYFMSTPNIINVSIFLYTKDLWAAQVHRLLFHRLNKL